MFSPTLTSLAKELNARVCESRRYFRSILIFMLKRFRLYRKKKGWVNSKPRPCLEVGLAWQSNVFNDKVVPVAHLWFWFLTVLFSHRHHIEWFFFVELVREKSSKHSGREHPSPLCAWMFCTKWTKKALCSMSVLKLGCISTLRNLPVFTAVIKLSAFADAFVKQSDKQFWVEVWAKSWILPEQASFRNIEITWIVSFCSGKWIVLAVVTTFFASVLMWIFAISPDMSIHNPRRNWREPQQFMKEYSSGGRHSIFNPLTFIFNQTSIGHSVFWRSLTRFW